MTRLAASEEATEGASAAVGWIVLAQLLGTSLWFSANSAAQDLQRSWSLTAQGLGWLTIAVQGGFVVGTLMIALTGTVNSQNAKLLALRANTLSVGATYGLAPFATMPEQDYFNLVANSPLLAATIRIQATFAILHRGEAASADARAARLQQHLKDYLKVEE